MNQMPLKLYLHLELKKKILNKGRVGLLVTMAMKLVDELLPYREDGLRDWVIFNNTYFDKKIIKHVSDMDILQRENHDLCKQPR